MVLITLKRYWCTRSADISIQHPECRYFNPTSECRHSNNNLHITYIITLPRFACVHAHILTAHHDHFTEQFGDIDTKSHTGYDLLHRLKVTPGVLLHVRTPQQCSINEQGRVTNIMNKKSVCCCAVSVYCIWVIYLSSVTSLLFVSWEDIFSKMLLSWATGFAKPLLRIPVPASPQ